LSALVIQIMAILFMPFVVIAVNTSAGRLLVPEGIIPNSPPAEVTKPGANPRRIGDRLVRSNDLTH
jgi:hypothetical protein